MKHDCAVYRAANILGKRWTLLILFSITKGNDGVRRYNEIKASLPNVSPKILSTRLKELEKEGLISKKVHTQTTPIRCDYSLTQSGKEFVAALDGFKRWASRWKEGGTVCPPTKCESCGI
ncbi:MAG: helix-turn-helix domain-containing protein [Nanoarchaeota archaeon]